MTFPAVPGSAAGGRHYVKMVHNGIEYGDMQLICEALNKNQSAWRHVVCIAGRLGLAAPAMSGALSYFDSYRIARLPHNLLQAQRDYFGSHAYERLDMEGVFHTDWGKLKR